MGWTIGKIRIRIPIAKLSDHPTTFLWRVSCRGFVLKVLDIRVCVREKVY